MNCLTNNVIVYIALSINNIIDISYYRFIIFLTIGQSIRNLKIRFDSILLLFQA